MTSSTNRSDVIPPLPWESLDNYAEQLFTPIKQGECVTTIWVRMAGRRLRNKFIIENLNLFPREVPNPHQYLLVYIEPLDLTEQSSAGYLRLIGNSILEKISRVPQLATLSGSQMSDLFKQDNADYSKLLNHLRLLLSEIISHQFEVILFLAEFDELEFATDSPLYNNLKSIWYSLQPNLHYVFLLMSNVENEYAYTKYKDLVEVLRQNIVYVPLLDTEESKYVYRQFAQKYNLIPLEKYESLILTMSGGHPNLIKVCTRIVAESSIKNKTPNEIEEILFNHYETNTICRVVYESLGVNSKSSIQGIVSGDISNPSAGNLALKLGLINKSSSGKHQIFGQLMVNFVEKDLVNNTNKNHKYSGKIEFNIATGIVSIGGENVDDIFTRQEYELLKSFLFEPGKLKSRDDIGNILWGDHAYEKYSDWAIDQIVSKLRKKLIKLGLNENIIVTLRGRGYKIVI